MVVMLAALLWYGAGIAGCALNAARRFYLNLFIMAATLVALAAATLLLVPAGGALGAGWALCFGMAVRFALSLGAALRL
jgi:O-antigen/teichoic acid export membrane protein